MYCILTKYMVADQMLKFGSGHMFLSGFTAVTRNSDNPYIRRRLGRLDRQRMQYLKWLSYGLPLRPECRDVRHHTQHAAAASTHTRPGHIHSAAATTKLLSSPASGSLTNSYIGKSVLFCMQRFKCHVELVFSGQLNNIIE